MEEADVVLWVGGERFPCHRSVLEKASPYFRAMFASDMMERRAEEIVIRDVEPDVFRILIDLVYERKAEVDADNVVSLTRTSDLLQFEEVRGKCCEFLSNNLDASNCVSLLILADYLSLNDLLRRVRSFLLGQFSLVDKENELSRLPLPLLSQLLSDDRLNCADETEAFQTIILWTRRNGSDHLVHLLSLLRFKSLSPDEMADIRSRRSIRDDSRARDFLLLVEEAAGGKSSRPDDRREIWRKAVLAADSPPRRNVLPLVSGGWISGSEETEEEDSSADGRREWRRRREVAGAPRLLIWTGGEFRELNRPFGDHGSKSRKHFFDGNAPVYGYVSCVVDNDLYCFGGEHVIGSGHWNKTIWKCDLRDGTWREVGNVENPRRHCPIAVLDKRVYLVGGYGKFRKRLTTVECYDTRTGSWQTKADLPAPVHSSPAVAFDGRIYVFSVPVYCYVPATDEWKEASLRTENGFSAAFVFKNRPYAVTRGDRAALLRLTLPDSEWHREFVFPTRVDCGCLCHNYFYGFNDNTVVVYDVTRRTCQTKQINGRLRSEMCSSLPNFIN
ncbi:kelch-like protein 24 [Centruroides sculpturatus]|uniref:kelch-like protein 24 n=1 Tax=Centruroides sculpturatus TaxID=218467 RepID=UPI000C6DE8E5|nr:kelch-like protein 24 [Centruroides sculpturatus]